MVRYSAVGPVVFVLALAACTPKAPAPVDAAVVPVASTSATVAAVDAGATAFGPTSRCQNAGPNEVSEDEHPYVVGVSGEGVAIAAWMKARGSTAAALYRLYGARYDQSVADATISVGEMCQEGKVGDPPEDALFCQAGSREMLHVHTMLAVVVRNKKAVLVIDEPINIQNLDDPEQHYLDLQFVMKSPTQYELRELAPEGSVLVRAPSDCLRDEKEGRDPNEHLPGFGYPQELHGCASAPKAVADMTAGSRPGDGYFDAGRHARALIARACKKDLGLWTWKNGQFVRDTNARH